MREIKINGSSVKMYDSIEDLPIVNYNLFNEYALKENQIGSDLAGIDKHFKNLDSYLNKGMIKEAIQVRKNMHQTYWNIFQGVNFPSLQFCCFIHSVDGRRLYDYSESSLKKLIAKLSNRGLTLRLIDTISGAIKKKLQPN